MKTETKMIFRDTTGFRAAITKVFGDIEEERIAEKNLQTLRQYTAVT